jgi:hypothetical protein
MSQPPIHPLDPDRLLAFGSGLRALILRYGGDEHALDARLESSVQQLVVALQESSLDGQSLSPVTVVQIRSGKFAASQLPATLYRDPSRLAALRAELRTLAIALTERP